MAGISGYATNLDDRKFERLQYFPMAWDLLARTSGKLSALRTPFGHSTFCKFAEGPNVSSRTTKKAGRFVGARHHAAAVGVGTARSILCTCTLAHYDCCG
jgi:hypothetical protein